MDEVPTRPQIFAGNWKMHMTRSETQEFLRELRGWINGPGPAAPGGPVEIILAPPFTALDAGIDACPEGVEIYAQNMHAAQSGAFTGEVSALMLRDLGVTGVILGHSERRQVFQESDQVVADKLVAALEADLRPILCVGETLAERTASQAEAVVKNQLVIALRGVTDARQLAELAIAYEPVWAIGTGQTATPDVAQQMHHMIRRQLTDMFGVQVSVAMPLLYGGSVKPDNAGELMSQQDIDGVLVGGASLKVADFVGIMTAARSADSGVHQHSTASSGS